MNMNKRLIRTIWIAMCAMLSIHTYAQEKERTVQAPLTFQEYLSEVSKNNLGYLAEKCNVSMAEAEITAQKVMPDPSIDFEAADRSFTLGLSYDLELGNKRGARVRLARSQAELERLALEFYFQELRAEAAELFLDAIQQRELLKVKQQSYQYMKELSKSDSIRFALGEISETDARQSRLEAATLLNEVFDSEANYQSAMAVLNQMMGRGVETLPTLATEWGNNVREYRLADLIDIGMEQRADLYAAHKNVEVAINQRKQVKAERRSDLGLFVNYERDWHGFLPQSGTVTGGVSIPLKLSNLNKGAVRAANFAVEQSKLQVRDAELQVEADIAQAFYQFEAAKKKVTQYQTGLLEEANQILNGMIYMYKRGETSITEVLIAQRTYNEVQEDYLGFPE